MKDLYELFYAAYEDARRIKYTAEKTMLPNAKAAHDKVWPSKMKNAVAPKRVRHRRAACVESKKQMPKGTPSCAVCRIKTRKRLSARCGTERNRTSKKTGKSGKGG